MTTSARTVAAAAIATAAVPLAHYLCAGCTYGVIVKHLPQRCPMCGKHVWRPDQRKG